MAFSTVHHADPKYQQQVLNEIQREEYQQVDEGGNTACVMHGVILYSVLTDPDCNISVTVNAFLPLYTFKRGVSGHMAVECFVLIFHLYIVRIKGYSIKGTLLTFFFVIVGKQLCLLQFFSPKHIVCILKGQTSMLNVFPSSLNICKADFCNNFKPTLFISIFAFRV